MNLAMAEETVLHGEEEPFKVGKKQRPHGSRLRAEPVISTRALLRPSGRAFARPVGAAPHHERLEPHPEEAQSAVSKGEATDASAVSTLA
jgi:hypothetical protein